ncbi:MAG: hypothetical protein ACOYM3_30575, partial [Terrimicrobiaceae bacterium]
SGASLTKAQIELAKFFLTARSRAPETNLFNLPRVAMWPIYKFLNATGTPNNAYTTAFDRLIAFCASTGEIGASTYHPYIFQRQDAYSATNDIGLPRNAQLLSYLTYLTNQPAPGFGGNFSAKYPTDRDQILTETFDYIRSANLQDATLPVAANRYTLPTASNLHNAPPGYGWVIPSQRGTGAAKTMGFGRCYTLSELSLVFICNAVADDSTTSGVDESKGSNIASGAGANAVLGGTALPPGEKYIQALILPEFFSPMQGLVGMSPDMQMTISGLETLKINGQPLFPAITTSATVLWQGGKNELSKMGGSPTYRAFGLDAYANKSSPARGNLPGDPDAVHHYPFIGIPIKITAPFTGGNMAFTAGALTVKLYAGTASPLVAANEIQTFTMTFPGSDFPVPEIVPDGVPYNAPNAPGDPAAQTTAENWWAYSQAGAVSGKPGRLSFIHQRVFDHNFNKYKAGAFLRPEYDTIRSMQPAHGDYRLGAASPDGIPFVEHPSYGAAASRVAATLSGENRSQRPVTLPGNDVGGKFISSVTYNANGVPDIPTGATPTPQATGDFDNGLANSRDGAYINKPDEGDVNTAATNSTNWSYFPYFRLFTNDNNFSPVGLTFFSPNRQIPSSGMLGSLSTGVKAGVPWKTLLFRPQTSHPSYSTTIPDHLLMDLFWMPVVEPYAISDRFSTAGKINMNYQILPFTYIERSTGMRAVLKAERLAAIPNTLANTYKGDVDTGADFSTPCRL